MKYYDLIELIKRTSLKHPLVATFFLDKYALSGGETDIDYGVISLLTEEFRIGQDINVYNFKILYADMVHNGNELQIESTAIAVLNEIMNELSKSVYIMYPLSVNTFRYQFADMCAGAIADVSITVRSDMGSCSDLENDICSL